MTFDTEVLLFPVDPFLYWLGQKWEELRVGPFQLYSSTLLSLLLLHIDSVVAELVHRFRTHELLTRVLCR